MWLSHPLASPEWQSEPQPRLAPLSGRRVCAAGPSHAQGSLAGYRGNFVAILKVCGPLLQGALYVASKRRGLPQLPFLLNAACLVVAFVVAIFALRPLPHHAPSQPPAARARLE